MRVFCGSTERNANSAKEWAGYRIVILPTDRSLFRSDRHRRTFSAGGPSPLIRFNDAQFVVRRQKRGLFNASELAQWSSSQQDIGRGYRNAALRTNLPMYEHRRPCSESLPPTKPNDEGSIMSGLTVPDGVRG
jgi:hypothetical protein